MRNTKYREELQKLNKVAWDFYRRHVCHEDNKTKSGIQKTMKTVLSNLGFLVEEAESIGKKCRCVEQEGLNRKKTK